jgi:hypothetical protein
MTFPVTATPTQKQDGVELRVVEDLGSSAGLSLPEPLAERFRLALYDLGLDHFLSANHVRPQRGPVFVEPGYTSTADVLVVALEDLVALVPPTPAITALDHCQLTLF